MVEDHLRQTDILVDALERDWHKARAAELVPDGMWKNWAEWLAGWRKFYQDSQGLLADIARHAGLPGAVISSAYVDRSRQYRATYKTWQKRLRSLGAELASPEPTAELETNTWARDIAIGLGVVGASFVLGAILRGRFSR